MTVRYTDQQIASFLSEQKALPENWQARARMSRKRKHKERHIDIEGADGSEFRIILKQSEVNVLDFSVILGVLMPQSNLLFRLRRCNGKSHPHTNRMEGNSFYDFHIHMATERYQEMGMREDAYAETTDRYGTFDGALQCLYEDANIDVPGGLQLELKLAEGG